MNFQKLPEKPEKKVLLLIRWKKQKKGWIQKKKHFNDV